MSSEEHKGEGAREELAVAIITPSGIFPGDDLLQRTTKHSTIGSVLHAAAAALKLTNTEGWVVRIGERHLNPAHTFSQEGLKCLVDIDWHKPEGGGGA